MTKGKKKTKINEFEKAKQDIKRIGFFAGGILVLLLTVGLFVGIRHSYAAIDATFIPDSFTSRLEGNIMTRIGTIAIPTGFTGVYEGGDLNDIYCLEHRLGMNGNAAYHKGASVSTAFPGIISILENASFNTGESLYDQYLTQIAIWWYVDLQKGYDNHVNYITVSEPWSGTETTEDDKYTGNDDPNPGQYRFYNNLSKLDKENLLALAEAYKNKTDQTDQARLSYMITTLVNEALAYKPVSDNITLNAIDTKAITFHIVDNYIETSDIFVTSSADDAFTEYNVKSNSSAVVVNENGIAQSSFSKGTPFRLRIGLDEIQGDTFNFDVSISANFRKPNAYVYNPENADYQRTILGVVDTKTASINLNVNHVVEFGKVIIHKQDAATEKQIEGATFVIKDSSGQVTKFVTGKEPVEFSLPIGDYTLIETIVPEGYSVETDTTTFTVTKGNTAEVIVKNTKEINVPDTSMDAGLIYGIGISIVVIGIILIVIAMKPNEKKRK